MRQEYITRYRLLLLAHTGPYPPYYENSMVLLSKEPLTSPPGDSNEPNEHLD